MADAGRVIAGSARGVRLAAPGPGTRPLTDRVKQTLFGILEPELDAAVVLDLFAGSGAGGIEALSRGAASADFVERDPGACRVIAENLRRAKLEGSGRVIRRDAVTWLAAAAAATAVAGPATGLRYDLVLVDPPYADTASLVRVLEGVGPVVREGGVVVSKHFWRDAPPARIGLLASERERRFGETALTFYRREAGEA
ncbi:MAG TPA: 16S rRNA (guanine(966)-N(2))-methyltransferase RsmD [Candidatus Limnocylindrales bacterium]|nr:16S rRNA (guanine(966)-N(2))-methyltransferase RsmD [Candidatus Limnocylindrales bacterium]